MLLHIFFIHENTQTEHLYFLVVFTLIIIQFVCVTLNTQISKYFDNYSGSMLFDILIQSGINMQYHPITQTIVELLKKYNIWFETLEHEAVTTSEDAARVRPDYVLHQGAKAIVVKGEKKNKEVVFLMLVVPADLRLDSKKIKGALDLRSLRFASEEEISDLTQGIQRGGVPPFGNLFFKPITVYIDPKIFESERIIFNAGDRCFSVAMKSEDYKRLVCPLEVDIVES